MLTRERTESEINTKCFICEDHEPETVNIPCLHAGQCKNCAKTNLGYRSECAHCKKKILKIAVYSCIEESEQNPGQSHQASKQGNLRHVSDLIPFSIKNIPLDSLPQQ